MLVTMMNDLEPENLRSAFAGIGNKMRDNLVIVKPKQDPTNYTLVVGDEELAKIIARTLGISDEVIPHRGGPQDPMAITEIIHRDHPIIRKPESISADFSRGGRPIIERREESPQSATVDLYEYRIPILGSETRLTPEHFQETFGTRVVGEREIGDTVNNMLMKSRGVVPGAAGVGGRF